MKIYTNTFDVSRPSPHRFWVAPYSDFKIGVKLVNGTEAIENEFTVKAGSVELTPDETQVDGFTTYTIKSNGTGFVDYTIEVDGIAQKFNLVQIVTDSTVFEVGGEGGGDVPADVATQTWVNSQISDFITDDALVGYATESFVNSAISDFVEEGELTAYAETSDLTAYYTKSETSSATEIGTALEGKQPTGDYALTSQIPTVNDGTLTILQGGVEKGTFTANQSGNVSVELDAGGGGGSAISAFDMSENPVQSKTLVEEAFNNHILLPQTTYKKSGSDSIYVTNSISGYGTNSGVTEVNIGTNCTTIGDQAFQNRNMVKTIRMPNSIESIGDNVFYSYANSLSVDFGNTRTTIPTAKNATFYGLQAGVKFYVPDALYDTWVAANYWSSISSQIHRHSELEAPYATSTALSALSAADTAQNTAEAAQTGLASKVDHNAGGSAPEVLEIVTYYESEYAQLSVDDPSWEPSLNTMYVILPDQV